LNTVVYYPTFYPSANWLRVASLCWDHVYSLRTPNSPEPTGDVLELDAALGGVLAVADVISAARDEEVQESFIRWLDHRAERRPPDWSEREMSRAYGEDLFALHREKVDADPIWDALDRHGLIEFGTAWGEEKVPRWQKEYVERLRRVSHGEHPSFAPPPPPTPRLGSRGYRYERLSRKAWKRKQAGDENAAAALETKAEKLRAQSIVTARWPEDVVYVPRDVALEFLSLCAASLATRDRRDLAALEERFADAALESVGSLRGSVMTNVVEAYLPGDLDHIEPERLCELRKQLAEKRHAFQADVQELVDKYVSIASAGEAHALEDELVKRAKASVEKTRKVYLTHNIEIASQVLGISFTPPAIASLVASALGIGILAPVGVAAAVGLAAAKAVTAYRSASDERAESGWSYVLELKRAAG
jgi:hypothetical protein